MNNKLFNKIIKSRLLYLFLGLFFAFVVFSVQAAWNTKVNPGDTLTVTLWNDIVDKLILLDSQQFSASAEYSVTEPVGDGNCTQTLSLGNHLACFLTQVQNQDTDDSGNINDDYYCRIYNIGPVWYLETYASRQVPCVDNGWNSAVCSTYCIDA